MTVSEDLYRSHGVRLERGHTVGTYENAAGEVCMVGAFLTAVFGSVDNSYDIDNIEKWQRVNRMRRALWASLGNAGLEDIESWSDNTPPDISNDALLLAAKQQSIIEALS